MLVEIAPDVYGGFVVLENGRKVLYVQVIRALYGMLKAALYWYKKFRADLEGQGYVFNPYDPCVCNKMVDGKQHTVVFHVDDLMGSHVDPEVNTQFLKWLNEMYGAHGEVKAKRGPVHDFLGMTFDFSDDGIVKVDTIDYMCDMVDDFSIPLSESDVAPEPAGPDLFTVRESDELEREQAEEFHTVVAKGLWACKRTRPDIHTAIAGLCTRVQKPNQDDWKKLIRLLKYINGTREDKLILSADDLHTLLWSIDASFGVHHDFKSHTGGALTLGRGCPISGSGKQKLNTSSSTHAELVGVDDFMPKVLWSKLFMEAQGYEIKNNVVFQDNKSAILLEKNGQKSSGKRSRALNIRYFFITDQIEKGNVRVEYCSTDRMVSDFMTKPLTGRAFQTHKKTIMGH